MSDAAFHVKYRPQAFDEVLGNELVVKGLKRAVAKRSFNALLLTGPSGVGKTTLARIVAKELGCDPRNVLEIDAASHTGIDAMRELLDKLRYRPFGQSSARMVIIDEAHALSKQAFQAMLKSLEEPSEDTFWALCTTELGKVPQTIRTRCHPIVLKEVTDDDLEALLTFVASNEDLKLKASVIGQCVEGANGSPRQALVNLSACASCTTAEEASDVLRTVLDSDTTISLCRALAGGVRRWDQLMQLITPLQDKDPESVRIVVVNYMSKVAMGSKKERDARHALEVLDAFGQPYASSDKAAPLLLSLGKLLFRRGNSDV